MCRGHIRDRRHEQRQRSVRHLEQINEHALRGILWSMSRGLPTRRIHFHVYAVSDWNIQSARHEGMSPTRVWLPRGDREWFRIHQDGVEGSRAVHRADQDGGLQRPVLWRLEPLGDCRQKVAECHALVQKLDHRKLASRRGHAASHNQLGQQRPQKLWDALRDRFEGRMVRIFGE